MLIASVNIIYDWIYCKSKDLSVGEIDLSRIRYYGVVIVYRACMVRASTYTYHRIPSHHIRSVEVVYCILYPTSFGR